jgi:hypothetical protein
MIDANALFAEADRVFAGQSPGTLSHINLCIAGHAIHLRFATAALAQSLSRAFRHLQSSACGAPDLTLLAWRASTDTAPVPLPPGVLQTAAIFQEGTCRLHCDLATGRIAAFDPTRRLGLLRFADRIHLAPDELASPFLVIFHWWAGGMNFQLVHGAAVATGGGAVLLAGRGGSGKSTTALACIGSSLRYLADDYCLLAPSPAPQVHSLFSTGKADARSLSLLPRLAPAFEPPIPCAGSKSVIYLAEHEPAALMSSAALKAIVVPSIGTGASCNAHPISGMQALRALAPSTVLQLAGNRAQSLARIATSLRGLPCWKLELGADPAAAQGALQAIIDQEP